MQEGGAKKVFRLLRDGQEIECTLDYSDDPAEAASQRPIKPGGVV